jgi:hypothetical protein
VGVRMESGLCACGSVWPLGLGGPNRKIPWGTPLGIPLGDPPGDPPVETPAGPPSNRFRVHILRITEQSFKNQMFCQTRTVINLIFLPSESILKAAIYHGVTRTPPQVLVLAP